MTSVKKCKNCKSLTTECPCFSLIFKQEDLKKSIEKEIRFKKVITIIEGRYSKEELSFVKKRLGCGGKRKDNFLELQGRHKERLLSLLK